MVEANPNVEAKLTRDEVRDVSWPDLLQEALTVPGSMGNTYGRFYNFSLRNQLLLRMQGVAEPVATFKGWQAVNRQVVKGAKAKAIMRPIFRKDVNEHGDEESQLSGFKVVNCIFGLSDTEGEELPPPDPRVWDKAKALGKLSITEVPFSELNGNTAGYSIGRQIAINPLAPYPLKTTFHELAHVELGHTTGAGNEDYEQHRGVAEFQAEGTAYLAMHDLELTEHFDPAESRHYIQTWLSGKTPEDNAIKAVFTAADRIIRAGLVETAIGEAL